MFFKILERIMYNRFYSYLTENNILFNKQFGLRAGHSTEHALSELVDQIINTFNYKKYLLSIFIDLSETFDTVDHKTLIQKLKHYAINGKICHGLKAIWQIESNIFNMIVTIIIMILKIIIIIKIIIIEI